jgi:outer membrane protein, multidrug efflux system
MNRQYILGLLFTGCWLLLSGCAGQIATHEEAVEGIKAGKGDEKLVAKQWSSGESTGLVDDGWLKSFKDPQLSALVDEAEKNNFGLKIAAAQVEQASALAVKAGAALKPTVGLSGGYAGRDTEALSELYGGSLAVSWEADVWGRIRSGVAGAEETLAATRSDFEFARQSLAATTANAWFFAISSKLLADTSNEIVELLQESVRIVESKESIGQGTMTDVHLGRADLATAQEAARQTLSAEENAKRSLELLLGRYPSAQIETTNALVAVPPPVSAGIPSQLLERRPDLIAAEQQVAAAFYRQKEAELLKLPRFTFSIGLSLNNLTDAASSLAAGVFAPLYTGGALEADIARATAEQNEAIAAYAQTALQAFKEVETALANEEHLMKREEYLQTVVSENYKAFESLKTQYEIGVAQYLDVLTVQNKWIQARIALINTSTQRLLNRVQLHLALGGSFEESVQSEAVVKKQHG